MNGTTTLNEGRAILHQQQRRSYKMAKSKLKSILLRTWPCCCFYHWPNFSLIPLIKTTTSSAITTHALALFYTAIFLLSSFHSAADASNKGQRVRQGRHLQDQAKESNITILDLYPELREYLWKKAVAQLSSTGTTTTTPRTPVVHTPVSNENYPQFPYDNIQSSAQSNSYYHDGHNQNTWGSDPMNTYLNNYQPDTKHLNQANNVASSTVGAVMNSGSWNSRDALIDAKVDDPHDYNYYKEVLKHWYPLGTPEFWDSWKFKPQPIPQASSHSYAWTNQAPSHSPPPSYGWAANHWTPAWEEEEPNHHHHHHAVTTTTQEISKDVSCLAGLLGLKTLKTLKFGVILKKLKLMGISLIAFKLGILLSPIAIPLLFPIIILATTVKILPLVIIIILLLKILKKQIKVKKPFGKFLDNTGSYFFDDMDFVTEKVLRSNECVDKISCTLGKKKKRAKLGTRLANNTGTN